MTKSVISTFFTINNSDYTIICGSNIYSIIFQSLRILIYTLIYRKNRFKNSINV